MLVMMLLDCPLVNDYILLGMHAVSLYSLGTKIHEETSWYSFASIFKYFTSEEDYMQLVTKPEEPVTRIEDEPSAKTEEPITKTEDEPEELVTKTEEESVTKTEEESVTKTEEEPATKIEDEPEEPVTQTDEPVTKTEDRPEEPVTKTEDEPEELVTKTEEESVTKTEEEPATKIEDEPEEPVTKTEESVTKTEEPVTKSEEPVSKYQELDKDIDKRVDASGHHQSDKKKFTESHPSDDMEPTSCCVII